MAMTRDAQIPVLKAERHGERTASSLVFLGLLWLALFMAALTLLTLIVQTLIDGIPRLDANMLTGYTSQIRPNMAGARAGILGSAMVIGFTALISIPLGIAAALYLEEFADRSNWFARLVEINLQNLAAVPAIIYGMLAAGLAISTGIPRNVVLMASLALAMLILPVIIITTREALRAVPREIRSGSLALGATPLQTALRQTLPAATPGIATGAILALSRALGEASPLLLLGAATYIKFDPNGLMSQYTTMPIQIFDWAEQPQKEFHVAASAAIIVLLTLLLAVNALAIVIRKRAQKRW